MLADTVVKSVRFKADAEHQPLDKQEIYTHAPEKWDVCVWDQGSIKPLRKKRSVIETLSEDDVSKSE